MNAVTIQAIKAIITPTISRSPVFAAVFKSPAFTEKGRIAINMYVNNNLKIFFINFIYITPYTPSIFINQFIF